MRYIIDVVCRGGWKAVGCKMERTRRVREEGEYALLSLSSCVVLKRDRSHTSSKPLKTKLVLSVKRRNTMFVDALDLFTEHALLTRTYRIRTRRSLPAIMTMTTKQYTLVLLTRSFQTFLLSISNLAKSA